MIHLFQKKPILRDLIPNNHVDIHSHLLPGIDDGAATIEDSISLLNQMSEIGFKNIITTPHIITNVWENSESSITDKHKETLNQIGNTPISSFKAAAEYMIDSHFLTRLASEKLLTLKDNYVLVELSYLNPPINLYEIIFEIQLGGYKPIMAHPERYLFYHFHFKEYEKMKNAGCFFQLNLLSTVGYYGEKIAKVADKLFANEFYDFVGSDVHHQNHINSFNNKVIIKNIGKLNQAIEKNLFFLK